MEKYTLSLGSIVLPTFEEIQEWEEQKKHQMHQSLAKARKTPPKSMDGSWFFFSPHNKNWQNFLPQEVAN